jgi:hypothetical protein
MIVLSCASSLLASTRLCEIAQEVAMRVYLFDVSPFVAAFWTDSTRYQVNFLLQQPSLYRPTTHLDLCA